jgi:cytochrome c oxidase accessory protein FixG
MTKIERLQPWRRLVRILEAAIILGLPFLTIAGESAFRFDIPTLRLHFFGLSLWMEEFFILLVGILFVTLLFVLITLMFGRVWCGWLCPQTVLSDFTKSIDKVSGKGAVQKIWPWMYTFFVSILVAANLIWYFVSPYDFFSQLLNWHMGKVTWGFWVSLTVILFLNFALVRHKFCATICPYSKFQSVFFDDKTLVISMDPRRREECIECMACVKECPVGIDIRKGLSSACISCAECIDRCSSVMDKRQKKSLIGYFFGVPEKKRKLLRQNVVMIGSVTFAFSIFFLYLLFVRSPLDLTILPNYSFPPRIARDGGVINSYVLSVKNRGRSHMDLEINVEMTEGRVKIVPATSLQVKAGELKKVPVYISIKESGVQHISDTIDITVQSKKAEKLKVTRQANFIIPEK